MAKFNKTMTLTTAIVLLTIVRASDISTSYNASSKATSLDMSSTLSFGVLHRVTFVPLAGTLCAFGVIGNSLSFAVLHMYSSGNVGAYLLKALAVTDNIFLATTLGFVIYNSTELFLLTIIIKVLFVLVSATMSWTVWMIVIVAGNRYIAVCRPLVASMLCTLNTVRLEILIMAGTVCGVNIPFFFYLSGNYLFYINICISLYICIPLAADYTCLLQCPIGSVQ